MRMLLWLAVVGCIAYEMKTSRFQAALCAQLGRELTFWMGTGPSPAIRFPAAGPLDDRRGYTQLPRMIRTLAEHGYAVSSQARFSPALLQVTDAGFFTPYHEKDQAGLHLSDRQGQQLYGFTCPARVYPSFASIPPVIVQTLLFIENRDLLDLRHPCRNPAVDWRRLGKAALQRLAAGGNGRGPGGSTLATQLEKFRHSAEGRTIGVVDKLSQMGSASLRAYLDGPETLDRRCRIVCEYINAMPLGAFPGYGEIIGLGDGLWAWYGAEFDAVNHTLLQRPRGSDDPHAAVWGMALKQVLSLFIAQRRPAQYLIEDFARLEAMTDRYLRLLAQRGIITDAELTAASGTRLRLRRTAPSQYEGSFLERKASNAVRFRLLTMLGVPQLYQLDRLDLSVAGSIDAQVQEEITWALHRFRHPEAARAAGLYGSHMLDAEDPANITYSFMLYERGRDANYLRVQTDNYDRPLDINEGIKLELGSTAKLRTLVTYLEIVAELHRLYADRDPAELASLRGEEVDALTQWAAEYLIRTGGRAPLSAMLDAALERMYSASPHEQFFTGGGLHRFKNFNRADDDRVLTVREAFRHSVNLVFIRMMRDIVRYYIVQRHASLAGPTRDRRAPGRREYLTQFADQEGRKYLTRFYQRYRAMPAAAALKTVLAGIKPSPVRLAVLFRSVMPDADLRAFAAFLREHLPQSELSDSTVASLYRRYGIEAYSLVDRAFLARVHPLELWTIAYLRRFPGATLADALRDSAAERQAVYTWLFKTRSKQAQDTRIQIIMEYEAFQEIHRAWKRMGYPFDALVPSYATAIGSSADRPAALAELIGIMLNDGRALPSLRVERLHFAEATPYETIVQPEPRGAEQVLAPEICRAVRRELEGVVAGGTAAKLSGVFRAADGSVLPVGGKTGTGDNRCDVYNADGELVRSRKINRTASFVFFIGDRFFGTITAYVAGADAEAYRFTSALPVQVLKALAPKLMPLLTAPDRNAGDHAG